MPKMKTNRGAAKRFKKTGSGGFKRKRHLRMGEQVAACDVPMVRRMLPFS